MSTSCSDFESGVRVTAFIGTGCKRAKAYLFAGLPLKPTGFKLVTDSHLKEGSGYEEKNHAIC